jgi:hypothetical protein
MRQRSNSNHHDGGWNPDSNFGANVWNADGYCGNDERDAADTSDDKCFHFNILEVPGLSHGVPLLHKCFDMPSVCR